MLRVLTAPRPSSTRGVALVSLLLADGAGPLYSSHCTTDLRSSLAEATAELDSSSSMVDAM